MDEAYKNQIRELISAEIEPRNTDISELLIDAMTGDRPPQDILSIMESITLLCLDGAYVAYPKKGEGLAVEFAFRWRLDPGFSVIMKMTVDIADGTSTIEVSGGDEPDDADERWRELHAKCAAKDAEGSYRCAKAVVAELFKNAGRRESHIVEVGTNGESP